MAVLQAGGVLLEVILGLAHHLGDTFRNVDVCCGIFWSHSAFCREPWVDGYLGRAVPDRCSRMFLEQIAKERSGRAGCAWAAYRKQPRPLRTGSMGPALP